MPNSVYTHTHTHTHTHIYIYISIVNQQFVDNFLNEPALSCFDTVKWFQIFLFNTNHSNLISISRFHAV